MLRETWDRFGNLISSEPETPPPAELYPLDIVALFTPAELSSIENSSDLRVVAFRAQFFAAVNPITTTDPKFIAAVAALQSLGILSAERSAAALTNQKPEGGEG